MPILFRKGKTDWQPAAELPYGVEDRMQEMLYESPSLIPVLGGEKVARVFIREAGLPGSGRTDLVGADEKGNIYIVECKLATNREIRREVIGQVLEYAAHLWQKTFDWFDQLFVARRSKSLKELLAEAFSEDVTYEAFCKAIAENLKSGNFYLLIAVDEMKDELARTIAYLNRREDSTIHLQAIGLSLYGKDELEILVPELYGEIPLDPVGGSTPDPPLSELLALADKRGMGNLTAICRQMNAIWEDARPSSKFGGSLRYFVAGKLVLGLSISGQRLDPPTPSGQLDVWIPTATFAEVTGVGEDDIRRTLRDGHPFFAEVGNGGVYVIRLQDVDQAQKLVDQLKKWATPGEPNAA